MRSGRVGSGHHLRKQYIKYHICCCCYCFVCCFAVYFYSPLVLAHSFLRRRLLFFKNTDKRTISDVRGQQPQLPTGQRVTATGSRSSTGLGGWARRIRLLEHMGYSSLLAACVSSSPGIVTSTRGMLSTLTGLFMAGGDFSPPGSAGVDTQRAITAKGLLELVTFRVLLSWWPGRILRIFFRSEWDRLC